MKTLDELEVKGKAHRADGNREQFDWRSDVDANGCDTPNDVLRRDLDNLVLEPGAKGCIVTAGDLDDKYRGESIAFERGSVRVDIDHIVSRANAWQTGAAALSANKLRELGSDPLNLLAVSSETKRQKSGSDAATWLPPNESYQCEYVSRQIAVKQKYGLWVAAAEKDVMAHVLEKCADQPAFTEDVAWPEPGEGDSVSTDSASAESTSEPAGESTSEHSAESTSEPAGESPEESSPMRPPAVGDR